MLSTESMPCESLPTLMGDNLETQRVSYTPQGRRTETINEGLHDAEFVYGPDNERKKMVLKLDGVEISTRYYHGNYEELHMANQDVYAIHYLKGGAIYVTLNGMNGQFYYTYKDYLGSLLAVTDSDGDVVGEQSFDAWGRYRDTETWVHTAGPGQGWPEWLTRGYTGHEHLPQFELVNMNGRMYDPKQARMLAVDNFVHDPYSTQGYNRYSYVLNNPLAYTDPSGENPIGALIGIAVGAVFNYLANAYNNNSWNPAQWTSGSITIGYSYNAGTGSSITTGGSVGNGPSFIAGMNVSTGNIGGGSSAYGMPSYSEVPGGSIPGINWGSVDAAAGWSPVQMGGPSGNQGFFVWQTDYSDMSGATAGGGVGDPPGGRWIRIRGTVEREISIAKEFSYGGGIATAIWGGSLNSAAKYRPKYLEAGVSNSDMVAQSARLFKYGKYVSRAGNLMTGADIGLSLLQYSFSNKSWGDKSRLATNLTIGGLGLIRHPITQGVSLGLGVFETAGGFDGFYNYCDFVQISGILPVFITPYPIFINLD